MEGLIQKIDDFSHPDSRCLAKRYHSNPGDLFLIPEEFRETKQRTLQKNQEIILDFDNQEIPVNCVGPYIRKVASAEIIFLELTRRDVITLIEKMSLPKITYRINNEEYSKLFSDPTYFTMQRRMPIEACKVVADYYDSTRRELIFMDGVIKKAAAENQLSGKFNIRVG